MDYKEAKRLRDAQDIVDKYPSYHHSSYRNKGENAVVIHAYGFGAKYKSDGEVVIAPQGTKHSWGDVTRQAQAFPVGVYWLGYSNPDKEYLRFLDGAGKEVHYVIPNDGLRLRKIRTVLDKSGKPVQHQYQALNPIQDYIIEVDRTKARASRKEVQDFIDYVRNLWDMLEIPDGFKVDSNKAIAQPTEPDTWHDFAVMRKFYYKTRSKYAPCWERRGGKVWKPKNVAEYGNKITILGEVYAELTRDNLNYTVRCKSPYTEPHHNKHWGQVEALREAGLLPECEKKQSKRNTKRATAKSKPLGSKTSVAYDVAIT